MQKNLENCNLVTEGVATCYRCCVSNYGASKMFFLHSVQSSMFNLKKRSALRLHYIASVFKGLGVNISNFKVGSELEKVGKHWTIWSSFESMNLILNGRENFFSR